MRKSNVSKILVAILAFSLLLGAVVGITAAATEEGESTVYLENSQIERNVKYTSKTYLLYRVAQSAIAEEDKAGLTLQVTDAEGSLVALVTPKVDGDNYVFETQGVPAKELNTKEIVTVMSGDKAISNAITWSVEEYLYARLYADKYADETEAGVTGIGEDDGKDFIRRELYYDLLKVGAAAQEVLAPDAEDKIGDSAFVSASDALATYGRFDEPTKVTLRYDESKTPEGEKFLGWEYAMYDSFGDLVKDGYAADNSVITTEGYVKARPVYESELYTHSYIDFNDIEDISELSTNSLVGVTLSSTGNNATASVVDGKFVLNQNAAGANNYWFVGPNTKLTGANTVMFEADFSLKKTDTNSEIGYFYVAPSFGAYGSTAIYWGYLTASSDGYVTINREFVRPSSGNADVGIGLKTPIKTDGTPCKLRIIYRDASWGEDYLEFYVNGELIHTTSNHCGKAYTDVQYHPKATAVGSMGMNLGANRTGIYTLDNVAMTQYITPEFEKLGVDETIVDFDGSSASVSKPTPANSANYQSETYDAKTGNGYMLLTKTATGSGLGIDVPVTYTAENANYAVLSFDYYMEDTVTRFDNQIYASHKDYSGGFKNEATPILVSLSTSFTDADKGKWIHVELTYEVLDTDDTGSVTQVLTSVKTTNGPKATLSNGTDADTGVYKAAKSYFNLFGNPGAHATGIEVPTAAEITGMRINLNNAALGGVRFDNLSLKLINKPSN